MTEGPLSYEPENIVPAFAEKLPRLGEGEVHLWQTSIDRRREPSTINLSPCEIDRAARTVMDRSRNAFLAARGFLRTLLGAYLGISPHEVEFVRSESGKLALSNIPSSAPLYFNISYSAELVLVGVTTVADVGVDVEYMREGRSFDDIAKACFSPVEVERLTHFSPPERMRKFYECWTMKEAFTKALGLGLGMALDSFEVDFVSGKGVSLSGYGGSEDISPSFTLKNLNPAPGYTGAVAVDGKVSSLSHYLFVGGSVLKFSS